MNNNSRKKRLVDDFVDTASNHLSADAVSESVRTLEKLDSASMKADTSYSANGSLASLVLYVKAQCTIKGGKTFDGSAWGVSFPGGGALFGDVYLSNGNSLDDLYEKTTNFTFTATPVYTAFYFYDKKENLLGHFQAGSVSTVTGGGHGDGSWS